MPTRGIPFPTGDPELAPEEERQLRRRLLERALDALQTPVDGPTVFDAAAEASGPGVAARDADAPAAMKAPAP